MGDIGGGLQAGASVLDTELTNAANLELQQRSNQFSAQQAGIQRDWSAQQAQKQMDFNASQAQLTRGFQTGEREAAQGFEERMSDTAIQRRADDIKKAGFNPLMAVGALGGASSPASSGMSGATASAGLPSGAAASSVSPPSMQPITPGFINALNSQSQRGVNAAQTDNLGADAELKKSQAALNNAKVPYAAQQAQADVAKTNQEIDTLVSQANKNLSEYDINENTLPNLLQDRQFRAQLQQGLVQLQALDIRLKQNGVREGAATADVMDSPLGRALIAGGLGHQAGGDVGGAAATLAWKIQQNPLNTNKRNSAMDVQISDPQNRFLEDSGIGAPTP